MSLDKIYFEGNKNSIFLDCTRLDKSSLLVSRKKPNSIESVDNQIKEISNILKKSNKREIVLVDDVVFSGNVLKSIISKFKKEGVQVVGIRSALSTKEAYNDFNNKLSKGLKCRLFDGRRCYRSNM